MAGKRLRMVIAATATLAAGAIGVPLTITTMANANPAEKCAEWSEPFPGQSGPRWIPVGKICVNGTGRGFDTSIQRYNNNTIWIMGPFKLDLWCANSWKHDGKGQIRLNPGQKVNYTFQLPNEGSQCHLGLWQEDDKIYKTWTEDVTRN